MARGAKFAFDLLGAPVDLITMGMRGVRRPIRKNLYAWQSDIFTNEYADLVRPVLTMTADWIHFSKDRWSSSR